jgi:pimeloyl-ACP methyl ester carboxylesterase
MPRVAVNGVELAYEEAGRGAPLVFISGTSVDRSIWGGQVDHFAPHHRCITFDNRDVGESSAAAAPYGMRDLAADTAALLEALDLPAAHVVGHSLGGAVAQELALLAPDRVRTITLVGSWARNDAYSTSVFHAWKFMRTRLEQREFLEAFLLFGVGHTFLNIVGTEQLIGMFGALPHPQPAAAFCRQVDADLGHDTLARLNGIGIPALVVAGEEDNIFKPHHHRALAEAIPGARLAILPAVGHTPPIESAKPFNRTLEEFLSQT